MPDPKRDIEQALSKSGVIPRAKIEPEHDRERPPERPTTLPEHPEETGATTGIMPVVAEGKDTSAERDDDKASGK
jgi:hypothetical protein